MLKYTGHVWVADVTGRITKSDKTVFTESELDVIGKIMEKPKEINYFKVSVNKGPMYFHPDHIVSIRFKVKKISHWYALWEKQ